MATRDDLIRQIEGKLEGPRTARTLKDVQALMSQLEGVSKQTLPQPLTLQEVARTPRQSAQSAQPSLEQPVSEPTIVSQSTPVGSSALSDFITQLQNQLTGQLRQAPVGGLSPTTIPSEIARQLLGPVGTNVTPDGTGSLDINLLQRLFTGEGQQRTAQDLTQFLRQLIPAISPAQTLEQTLLSKLSQKQPELATQKDKQGLKKFAGTGEIKVGSKTYRINNAGAIELVRG